jgi:hypothetical protein
MGTQFSTTAVALRRAGDVMGGVWERAREAAAGAPAARRLVRTCKAMDAGSRLLLCATVDAAPYRTRGAAAVQVLRSGARLRLRADLRREGAYGRAAIAVVIAADDVTLDGQGRRVAGFPFGVVVVPGCRRVVIRNIIVDAAAVAGLMALCVDGVTLDNVRIVGGGADMGICLLACTDIVAAECTVAGVHHMPATALSSSGIHARYCRRVRFDRCSVTDLRCEAGGCVGIMALGCLGVDVDDCVVDGLASGTIVRQALGHTCSGVFPFLSADVRVRRCRVRNVAGSCDDAHGVSVFACPGVVEVQACDINDVSTGGVAGSGAKATGVEVCVAVSVAVTDVHVHTVVAGRPQDRQCAGFATGTCVGVVLTRCSAAPSSSRARPTTRSPPPSPPSRARWSSTAPTTSTN